GGDQHVLQHSTRPHAPAAVLHAADEHEDGEEDATVDERHPLRAELAEAKHCEGGEQHGARLERERDLQERSGDGTGAEPARVGGHFQPPSSERSMTSPTSVIDPVTTTARRGDSAAQARAVSIASVTFS